MHPTVKRRIRHEGIFLFYFVITGEPYLDLRTKLQAHVRTLRISNRETVGLPLFNMSFNIQAAVSAQKKKQERPGKYFLGASLQLRSAWMKTLSCLNKVLQNA